MADDLKTGKSKNHNPLNVRILYRAAIDSFCSARAKSVSAEQKLVLALLNSLRIFMYYTYVLQSNRDKKFYVGFTKDLKLRFEQHNKGYVDSTKNRRPLELIYYEACLDQEDTIRREKYLKSYHGKMFIKNRLKSYLTG